MFNFIHSGSSVVFSITGYTGLLLLIYLIIEISSYTMTRSFFIHKLIISLRVRREIKKIIPPWWKVEYVSLVGIQAKWPNFSVLIRLKSDISTHSSFFGSITTYITTNWYGKIEKEAFTDFIKENDNELEVKKWLREKRLNEIGI